jgi:hypothetical protein
LHGAHEGRRDIAAETGLTINATWLQMAATAAAPHPGSDAAAREPGNAAAGDTRKSHADPCQIPPGASEKEMISTDTSFIAETLFEVPLTQAPPPEFVKFRT